MSAKGERRRKMMAAKLAKKKAQLDASGESVYARKRKYLDKHGLWGWEVPEPKPWRSVA